jgi:hypothetical protein
VVVVRSAAALHGYGHIPVCFGLDQQAAAAAAAAAVAFLSMQRLEGELLLFMDVCGRLLGEIRA